MLRRGIDADPCDTGTKLPGEPALTTSDVEHRTAQFGADDIVNIARCSPRLPPAGIGVVIRFESTHDADLRPHQHAIPSRMSEHAGRRVMLIP